MKLYKESKGFWAARLRLDQHTDVDITVQECGVCGKTITTVNFCKSYCPEGMIMDWGYDTAEVIQWKNNTFMGLDQVSHGTAKLFGWSGRPTKLQIAGNRDISLEYEQ